MLQSCTHRNTTRICRSIQNTLSKSGITIKRVQWQTLLGVKPPVVENNPSEKTGLKGHERYTILLPSNFSSAFAVYIHSSVKQNIIKIINNNISHVYLYYTQVCVCSVMMYHNITYNIHTVRPISPVILSCEYLQQTNILNL